MTGHVILHPFDTAQIVHRNFQIEMLQADGGLPGVGIDHHDRQTGFDGALAQIHDLGLGMIAAVEQQGADLDPVHRRQAYRDNHVRAIARSYQQAAGFEVLHHVVQGAGTEGDAL